MMRRQTRQNKTVDKTIIEAVLNNTESRQDNGLKQQSEGVKQTQH